MTKKKQAPAKTLEGREKQLISLAYDCAEKAMRDGTASSQLISHFLKMGSTRERREQERLEGENKLLRAKTEALENSKNVEELYKKAIDAMRLYSGQKEEEYDEDY